MPLNLKYLEMSQNSNNLSVPEKVQDGVSHTPLADAIICKSSSQESKKKILLLNRVKMKLVSIRMSLKTIFKLSTPNVTIKMIP